MALDLQHSNSEVKSADDYRQTADEHAQTLKDFWKRFFVSGLFVLAVIAVILACLAWFFSNNNVNATSSNLSAKADRYTLIADGEGASDSQVGYYERDAQRSQISNLDTTDSMTVTLKSNLNNYFENGIYPGARGKILFEVKPLVNDLNGVTINLSRIVQLKNNSVLDGSADVVDSTGVYNLLKGHLLFFSNNTQLDGSGFYSGRLANDTITLSKEAFYPKNDDGTTAQEVTTQSVPISLYWVWPEYFQNFVLTGNTNYYKNLFALGVEGSYSQDYNSLLNVVNSSKANFFYGNSGSSSAQNAPDAQPNMPSGDLAICADLYNQADEYIGDQAEYYQLRITATEGVNND